MSHGAGRRGPTLGIDFYALAPCATQDKVYDLPGVNLNVDVFYSGGATSGAKIFLRVLGR